MSRLDVFVRDARHSLRRLSRDWWFTTTAVLLLGLGIGANTALFSVVNAVLLRAMPLSDPDRLVDIYQNAINPGGIDASSYPAYLDMSAYTDVFSSTTAALIPRGATYQDNGRLRSAVVEHTTASYLSVFARRPSLGRWFTPAEDVRGAEVVAVLGYQAWTRRFGADPSVVGRTIRIDGVPVTIVGVGPAGHNGTLNIGLVTDFWLPIASLPAFGAPPRTLERRPEEAAFFVKARLREGVTIAQAKAAMDILGRRLAADYPSEDPGKGIRLIASKDIRVHPQADGPITALAAVALAIVGLVLAIACSNLATLLLVRGASRAKDISVRLAIGASRGQLVRQLLTESVLLSLAGGVAGCLLAWWGIQLLRAVDLPITVDVTLDMRVLIFAIALSLITGIACGLAPALSATRIDILPALRDDSATRGIDLRRPALKNALIVFQVAMSVLLLGGGAIFLQMVSASRAQAIGFAVDGVAMIETDARYAGYSTAQATTMYEELRRRIAALPGVEATTLTRELPMRTNGLRIVPDGAMRDAAIGLEAGMIWAGPGYFETLGIPILYGRAFDVRDRAEAPRVAVINETMARQYFGTVNAVGRRFREESAANSWTEIIGVVRDTGTADLQGDLVDPTRQLFYRSVTQSGALPTTLVARTSQDASALLVAMQRELRAVDATLPAITAKTMAQVLEDSLKSSKAIAALLAAFGALGLLLASIGLYAVVAFAVSRRSREIGIRLALGARRRQVIWSVTRGVAGLVGVGTAVGLTLSMLTTLALRAVVVPAAGLTTYRPSIDGLSLLAIAAAMALVALAAAWVPARRAALADPASALRHD